MHPTTDDLPLAERLQKLDALLPDIERLGDAKALEAVRETVGTLLEFHGQAIERILQLLKAGGSTGLAMLDGLAQDELVGSLLALHGLHPHDLTTRLQVALERLRPTLASHGGAISLLGVSPQGEVRLRLEGSCHGCPSSQATLKSLVEQTIYALAPDVTALYVEGVVEDLPPHGGFIPVEQLTTSLLS
jgi:Fe-S cluster biogenesis protein NfuA